MNQATFDYIRDIATRMAAYPILPALFFKKGRFGRSLPAVTIRDLTKGRDLTNEGVY